MPHDSPHTVFTPATKWRLYSRQKCSKGKEKSLGKALPDKLSKKCCAIVQNKNLSFQFQANKLIYNRYLEE